MAQVRARLGVVLLLAWFAPRSSVSASGGAWCRVPRRRLLKRASKRPGERGACAFACPPQSSPPISPVSSHHHDWPEAPVGSADNLNLASVQGAPRKDKGTRPGLVWHEREDSNVLNIIAIRFHGSEGYLGSRILTIVVVVRCTLSRCSLYPISYMQLVHTCVSCPATDQPSPTPQDQAVAGFYLAVASDECYPRAWVEDSG